MRTTIRETRDRYELELDRKGAEDGTFLLVEKLCLQLREDLTEGSFKTVNIIFPSSLSNVRQRRILDCVSASLQISKSCETLTLEGCGLSTSTLATVFDGMSAKIEIVQQVRKNELRLKR